MMMKQACIFLISCLCSLMVHAQRTFPGLFILGGELGNSSASSPEDIKRIFPKLERMGLNTVLVPVYWELVEPEKGSYDFSLVREAIQQAEKYHLKIVFLWFGAWKNSMSCYAPAWFKKDYKTYPRAKTRTGKPVEVASVFSANVLNADKQAFSQFVRFLAKNDRHHTVVMLQIENEVGMIESSRDFSETANKEFKKNVPAKLLHYIRQKKNSLHPFLLTKWKEHGSRVSGSWTEVFGDDIYTNELFMAWHYAIYIEQLAKEARTILSLPLYVNAALNSRGRKPGEYPSAGPLAHLKDIWKCAAPHIDFLAPDLYDKGFKDWVRQYALPDNKLFIPEIRLEDNDGIRAFYVFGEHDAIGFSPFSIEDGSDSPDYPLTQSYRVLKQLAPFIHKYRNSGRMKGLLFDETHKDTTILWNESTIKAAHYFTLPWDSRATNGQTWPEGGGLMIQLEKNEYLVAGSGIVLTFYNKQEPADMQKRGEDGFIISGEKHRVTNNPWQDIARCGLLSVDEVSVDSLGNMQRVRRLNGDQDHQGRHVRISVGEYKILHVKLYQYK